MRTLWAMLFVSLICLTHQASAEVFVWKKVGDWDTSFHDALPGCLASTTYEEGTTCFIGFIRIDNGLLLGITLMHDKWGSIESGKEYIVSAQIGDEIRWTIDPWTIGSGLTTRT